MEFAIVVVLLVTLLYGIVSYGLVFAVKNGANTAADDAARAALSAYNYDMTSGTHQVPQRTLSKRQPQQL